MKKKLTVFALLCLSNAFFGQVTIDYNIKTIQIDASVPINYDSEIDFSILKSSNQEFNYKIILPEGYNLSIERNTVLQPKLKTDSISKQGISSSQTYMGKISFQRNTANIFTVYKGEEKFTYKFKTKSLKSWTTTFGANAIIFNNRSKYLSSEKDGINTVVEVKDSKKLDLLPAVMFSFMNNQRDFSIGYTGGIGTNFEEITVFSGLSLGIGQNIIVTGGVGVSKQMTPNTDYAVGQIIDSSITSDNLNESQYRINPFIGISFRLDKNPFGKKTE